MVYCDFCGDHVTGVRPFDSYLTCEVCGKVLDTANFSTEATFVKNSTGCQMAGSYVKLIQSDFKASREAALATAKDQLRYLQNGLQMGDSNSQLLNLAHRLYTLAFDKKFTRGRTLDKVRAACLYLACREKKLPFLLIDFSSYLRISVYELGAIYLQLCKLLYIDNINDFVQLVDPSIFIDQFMKTLIPGDNAEVVKTARDIIASMKRDWMQTGRKPSGLCGAALYISALSHGIKCSKLDVVKVVHICEATLTKRLIEFENTESGSLSIEEFLGKAKDTQFCSIAKQPKNASGSDEVLCVHKHKDMDGVKPYAYGLCKDCHDDFMTISGGMEGGLDPPAFQTAERKRIAKLSAEEDNRNENAHVGTSQKSKEAMTNPRTSRFEKSHSAEPESIGKGTANEQVSANDDKLPEVDGSTSDADKSENLSDIDDVEVDCYLHTEEEKCLKKIIWENINREYVEEQAEKEREAAASKAAIEAKYKGDPEGLQAALKQAEADKIAKAKSRKERQQKRAADAKIATPPQNAAEAARQMLVTKRLSSKVNYDVFDKLFDEADAPENAKKQRLDENDDDDDDENYTTGKKEHENGDLGVEDDFENEGGEEEEVDYGLDYNNFNDEGEYYGEYE